MPFTFKLSQRLARMRWSAVVLTIAALGACEKPIAVATDPGGSTVSQLVVSPRAVTLYTNQTVSLTAVGLTSIGDTATVAVTWSATNGSVIDTSTTGGKHYGRYKAGGGTGTVKVIAQGHPGTAADTAVVTVAQVPVARVTVSPSSASVVVGQTAQLAATTTDSAGNVLSGRTVTWTSSNPTIAAVSGSGLVSAGTAGSVTITATSEGQSGTAAVSVSNVPVATVTVSPASASVLAGQTVQLAATTRDASGNVLTGRSIAWTTNNGSLATISGNGLVTGVTAGSATITATSEGQSGSATITVTSPPPPPGTVTDLAVAGSTDSSLTVTFTEVTDGTGNPSSYDVRYAAGTISWGSATEVSRGTCTTPVAGTAIGAKRTCTILGLNQSTNYGVQLVAFRGTLGVNPVFGGMSNVANGTTAAGAPAPVATVTVSPGSSSVGVGGTQQFTATLKDASGNVLTGRTVTWTSSALSVATVTGSGLVSALVAGTSTITATSEGMSGSGALTVTALPPPPSGSWPDEPSGFTVVTDYGLGNAIPVTQSDVPIPGGNGWNSIYNGNGYVSLIADAGAPYSPPGVVDFYYPVGFPSSIAPGTLYYNFSGAKELYAGIWWKPSNPWQGNDAGRNKICYLMTTSGSLVALEMFNARAPYSLGVVTEFPSDNRAIQGASPTTITLGQWHRLEWYFRYSSSSSTADGVMKVWLDGVLEINRTDLIMPADAGFGEFQLSPTFGGNGTAKTEADHFWFDHVHLSHN